MNCTTHHMCECTAQKLKEYQEALEFYANGAENDNVREFGCGCCAGFKKPGGSIDYTKPCGSEVQGITATQVLDKWK